MKSNKYSTFLYVLFISIAFTACKSKKALVKTDTIDRKLVEQVERIQKAQPVFGSANVSKMSIAVEMGGRKFNTSASCKIRSDSAIHISIQPFLGFELFKVELSKDSMLVFDKVNKKYYPLAFSELKTKFGITVGLSDIEALLSNQFFTAGSQEPDIKACKLAEKTERNFTIDFTNSEVLQTTTVNAENRITKHELKSTTSASQLVVDYSNFGLIDKFIFPQLVTLQVDAAKRNARFEFKISKAVFDTELSFTKMDVSKYSKGDLKQLLNK